MNALNGGMKITRRFLPAGANFIFQSRNCILTFHIFLRDLFDYHLKFGSDNLRFKCHVFLELLFFSCLNLSIVCIDNYENIRIVGVCIVRLFCMYKHCNNKADCSSQKYYNKIKQKIKKQSVDG